MGITENGDLDFIFTWKKDLSFNFSENRQLSINWEQGFISIYYIWEKGFKFLAYQIVL